MELLNEFILQAIASPWLYLVMFAVAIIDGFFPPVPSETVLVAAAAVAVSSGGPNLVLLFVAAAAGATIGDNIAYAIGRSVGTNRFEWMRRPRVAASVERATVALRRNAAQLILGARFVPVGRVAVNMSAGALGYPWRRFLPFSAAAGVTWATFSMVIGILAGQWLKEQPLLSALAGVTVAIGIGFIIDRLLAFRRQRVTAARDEHVAVSAGAEWAQPR
jgi:membrane protein DedA with SNARE-associated domain